MARFPIGHLEVRYFHPSDQRLRSDAGGAGGFFDSWLREQSSDRLFLFAGVFGAMAMVYHDEPPSLICRQIPIAIPNPFRPTSRIGLLVATTGLKDSERMCCTSCGGEPKVPYRRWLILDVDRM